MGDASMIDVAAGVLYRSGEVLLAERIGGGHGDGYWEFPGGKVESGESPREALRRELDEELGIQVAHAEPLITLDHRYPHRHVQLHVFLVREWVGEPQGREAQALHWSRIDALGGLKLLEANAPIVESLTLL